MSAPPGRPSVRPSVSQLYYRVTEILIAYHLSDNVNGNATIMCNACLVLLIMGTGVARSVERSCFGAAVDGTTVAPPSGAGAAAWLLFGFSPSFFGQKKAIIDN